MQNKNYSRFVLGKILEETPFPEKKNAISLRKRQSYFKRRQFPRGNINPILREDIFLEETRSPEKKEHFSLRKRGEKNFCRFLVLKNSQKRIFCLFRLRSTSDYEKDSRIKCGNDR